MYICNSCGAVFSTPDTYEEHHPYGMGTATETFSICPSCRDADIDEAQKCERCGEYVAELDNGLCEVCHGDMYGE